MDIVSLLNRSLSWDIIGWVIGLAVPLGFGFVAMSDYKLAKLCFAIAGAVLTAKASQWGIYSTRPLLARAIVGCVWFSVAGMFTVLAFRYVDHKQLGATPNAGRPDQIKGETTPLTLEGITRAVREAREPERADIITTLVIDLVVHGKVRYHLEVKNGELPVTITDITSQTSSFLNAERGPYIPKNLRSGEILSISGEPIGKAFPAGKDTNLDVQLAYSADVKGVHKDFISNYRFFVAQPVKPQTIFPFSVSHDEGQKNVDQTSADVAAKFALAEATVFLVLPEARLEDGKPNIVSADNGERRFLFNPATREVIFESKAQSGRVMRVDQSLRQTSHSQGLHLLTLLWTRERALLKLDGIEKEVRDSPAKKK